MAERKRTKAEERAYAELHDTLLELQAVEREMRTRFERLKADQMPLDWATIESRVPVVRPKTRVTTTLDTDVAKFFRAMGRGHQARMNAVLRAYMLAILGRAIGSKRNEDWMGNEI